MLLSASSALRSSSSVSQKTSATPVPSSRLTASTKRFTPSRPGGISLLAICFLIYRDLGVEPFRSPTLERRNTYPHVDHLHSSEARP
jgi:hypothetical protein